jgi:hypothetical protein
MRALADVDPSRDFERPYLDFAELHGPVAFGDSVCAIRFEIENIDDIAALAGPQAAREVSETVARRLGNAIVGPQRPRQVGERRFLVAVPLSLVAAVDFAQVLLHTITRPIVFGRLSIHVAVASQVVAGKRSEMLPALAEAA